MARKRTGQLIPRRDGWAARITVERDGEKIRETVPLGTTNKAVARRKLARLLAGEVTPAQAASGETYHQAAERIRDARQQSGVADVANERGRDRLHVLEHIGDRLVTEIRPVHVRSVLEIAADAGLTQQTVHHIRKTMHVVFDALWREETIPENPVAKVKAPRAKVDRRERAVLTDAELAVYLGWEHPAEKHRKPALERQTMACLSRMFGGLRTGDLHALTWEAFDTKNDGAFTWGWAPRRKTKRPQLLEVPEMLRPILRDWWDRHEKPATGLVFPVRYGERAGEGRARTSHAKAFRRDLRRAFGLDAPRLVPFVRKNGRADVRIEWETARAMTSRETELLVGTDMVKPVDFHSWRRAFNQALADADVNAQQAAALAGHADLGAHARYLVNTAKMRTLPEAALPRLSVQKAAPLPFRLRRSHDSASFPRARQDSNLRPSAPEALPPGETEREHSGIVAVGKGAGNPLQALATGRGLLPLPFAEAADAALGAYLRVMADGLAVEAGRC
jgi:integrase